MMLDQFVQSGLFLSLAVLLGLIVGVFAASRVDIIKLKSAYKLGYRRGKYRPSKNTSCQQVSYRANDTN